ncbi:glycoside hydrolase family 11 protein [Natronoglomus mannanivorans]|uniref:glycoside hydrolase family 11 protein n=1 Tax=Natronoglomus mannanivorans TaxID=2979990 RepID=UPI0030836954
MTNNERDFEETTEQHDDIATVAKDLTDFTAEDEQPTDTNEGERGSIGRRGYMKAVGAAAATGLGVGAVSAQDSTVLTENQQTSHDGYFVSFWTDTEGSVSMTLEDSGSYSVDWENTGNFVVGMGWDPGARRTIEYDATHNPTDNSYLCLYGWTTDPLVEYYIIENYGTYRPGDEEHGTHQSDGGTYDIATSERIEQPSIEGTATFTQYWSIRQNSRTSGTINIGNHFDAWESVGLELGSHDYQIMATEAYDYSGSNSASVTFSEVDGGSGGGGNGGSGGDDGGDPDDEPGDVSAWNAEEIYTEGDQVTYDGTTWEAQWWTQNEEPGAREYGPWEAVGDSGGSGDSGGDSGGDTGGDSGGDTGSTSSWDPNEVYTEGDRVTYDGSTWEAQWWTQNQEPGASQWGPWEEV